jgi:hypothetical protein
VYFCVSYFIVLLLPPGKNPSAVQLNNNNRIIAPNLKNILNVLFPLAVKNTTQRSLVRVESWLRLRKK